MGCVPRNRLWGDLLALGPIFDDGTETTYLVSASLFLLSRSWPVCAPLSFAFIMPSDCLVGKTASLFCIAISEVQIQIVVNVLPELQTS